MGPLIVGSANAEKAAKKGTGLGEKVQKQLQVQAFHRVRRDLDIVLILGDDRGGIVVFVGRHGRVVMLTAWRWAAAVLMKF